VSRPHLHRQIKEQLHDGIQDAIDTRILAVQGLGGSGKSQLVLDYVRKYREDYSTIFWVEAGQKESIDRDYLQIHRLLFDPISVTRLDTVSIEDAVAAVKRWFHGQTERSLLVLDSADVIDDDDNESYINLAFLTPFLGVQNLALDLISALQILPASRLLCSRNGGKNLFGDLSRLNSIVNSDGFDIERIGPLLQAVLSNEPDDLIRDKVYATVTESTSPPRPISSIQQTPWHRNTSSFANSSEHRKYVDDVLKEELVPMYVAVPGFFEAFFGKVAGLEPAAKAVFEKCKEEDNPLYQEESGWRSWPEGAKERDVLSWFAQLTGQLLDFHQPTSRARRRPLAQPHQPLQGSTAERKLDVGFVDDPNAGVDSKCHWSQILVPGELKSNPSADTVSKAWLDLGRYAREVLAAQDSRRFVLGFTLCGSLMRLWEFDRPGGIASTRFDINQEGLQFVSAVLGFLWMNEEQLGFDPKQHRRTEAILKLH